MAGDAKLTWIQIAVKDFVLPEVLALLQPKVITEDIAVLTLSKDVDKVKPVGQQFLDDTRDQANAKP